MWRCVESDDGGQVHVAEEDVKQEEYECGKILKWSPAPDMVQYVIKILDWF